MKASAKLLLAAAVFPNTTLASYKLSKDYSGFDFVNGFDFYNGPDPTNGHVQYKGYATANATGLVGFLVGPNGTNINNSTLQPPIYLGVDHTNTFPSDIGRPSVRVSSVQVYNHSLVLADILHMPSSTCSLWPAFWLLGTSAPWPNAGEIDIVENVNDNDYNIMTLHTSSGLTVSNQTDLFKGNLTTSNCDINAKGQAKNVGCSVQDGSDIDSYGTNFNKNGGGVFAMQYTPSHIAIWFFPRGNIPSDIVSNTPSPPAIHNATASPWGKPNALFQADNSSPSPTSTTTTTPGPGNTIVPINNSIEPSSKPSPLTGHFSSLQILFSTTFCGTWAGAVWNSSKTCSKLAPTCEEYVSSHPEAFIDAYWAIQSVKIYEQEKTDQDQTMDLSRTGGQSHVFGHLREHRIRKSPTERWLSGINEWRTWDHLVPLRNVI